MVDTPLPDVALVCRLLNQVEAGLDFEGVLERSHCIQVDDVLIPVASLDDLIVTKNTARPVDQQDVAALRRIHRLRTNEAGA